MNPFPPEITTICPRVKHSIPYGRESFMPITSNLSRTHEVTVQLLAYFNDDLVVAMPFLPLKVNVQTLKVPTTNFAALDLALAPERSLRASFRYLRCFLRIFSS